MGVFGGKDGELSKQVESYQEKIIVPRKRTNKPRGVGTNSVLPDIQKERRSKQE